MDEKEIKLTAYHEGGHAVLAKLVENGDPVHQVTVIPRGNAGGFTMQLPEHDRNYRTKSYLFSRMIVALGGHLAEKAHHGRCIDWSFKRLANEVTNVARAMITKYGMSDNLPVMSYDEGEEVFIGRDSDYENPIRAGNG